MEERVHLQSELSAPQGRKVPMLVWGFINKCPLFMNSGKIVTSPNPDQPPTQSAAVRKSGGPGLHPNVISRRAGRVERRGLPSKQEVQWGLQVVMAHPLGTMGLEPLRGTKGAAE